MTTQAQSLDKEQHSVIVSSNQDEPSEGMTRKVTPETAQLKIKNKADGECTKQDIVFPESPVVHACSKTKSPSVKKIGNADNVLAESKSDERVEKGLPASKSIPVDAFSSLQKSPLINKDSSHTKSIIILKSRWEMRNQVADKCLRVSFSCFIEIR